jgi:NitT/TauT family transport system substrate-binding protein
MALAFMQKYPDQAMRILQKYTQVDAKTIAAAKEVLQHAYPATPVADEHAYDVAVAFDIKAGLITSAPPYQQLVDTQTAVQALQGFRSSVRSRS